MKASDAQMVLLGISAAAVSNSPVSIPWEGAPVRNNRTPYVGRETGRNKPCPCGSGKKYKKCCMRRQDDG